MMHNTESQNASISLFGTGRKMTELTRSSRLRPFTETAQGQRVQEFGADSARRADHQNFLSFSVKTRQSPTKSVIAQYEQRRRSLSSMTLEFLWLKVLSPAPEFRLWWICCRPRPTFCWGFDTYITWQITSDTDTTLCNTTLFWHSVLIRCVD